MKILAIIIGTLVASVVLGIAIMATVMYLSHEPEEFSRSSVYYMLMPDSWSSC